MGIGPGKIIPLTSFVEKVKLMSFEKKNDAHPSTKVPWICVSSATRRLCVLNNKYAYMIVSHIAATWRVASQNHSGTAVFSFNSDFDQPQK